MTNKSPKDYFPIYLAKTPGAMETHWMPLEPELRTPDRYLDFLAERRKLLAIAANSFLNQLLNGSIIETTVQDYINRTLPDNQAQNKQGTDDDVILEVSMWMKSIGLNEGEMFYDLSDDTGKHIATIDLAWPTGIQSGLSEPVALLLGAPVEVLQAVNYCGYRYFTDATTFKQYVEGLIS